MERRIRWQRLDTSCWTNMPEIDTLINSLSLGELADTIRKFIDEDEILPDCIKVYELGREITFTCRTEVEIDWA